MKEDKKDVIVVGAGLCGLVASKILVDAGLNVLVLERSNKPGEKCSLSNVMSSDYFEGIFSRFWENESNRIVSSRKTYIFQDDNLTKFNWDSLSKHSSTFFIAFNKIINNVLASEVQSSGGNILFGQTVRELIVQNNIVTGVKTDEHEYQSNVVAIAEGANSLLTKSSGLRKGEFTSEQSFLFLEEKIDLSKDEINERFGLKDKEGCVIKLFISLKDLKGTGFITTHKDSIVLSVGVKLSDLIRDNININECLAMFKTYPSINFLVSGGTVSNFTSFMLPSVNNDIHNISLPKICANGCVLIGGATALVDPFSYDVISLPLKTSKFAAEAIIHAKQKNNFSEQTLSLYPNSLKKDSLFNNFINTKSKIQECSLYLTSATNETSVYD